MAPPAQCLPRLRGRRTTRLYRYFLNESSKSRNESARGRWRHRIINERVIATRNRPNLSPPLPHTPHGHMTATMYPASRRCLAVPHLPKPVVFLRPLQLGAWTAVGDRRPQVHMLTNRSDRHTTLPSWNLARPNMLQPARYDDELTKCERFDPIFIHLQILQLFKSDLYS